MKSSWKTTVGGYLLGGGLAFSQTFPEWARWGAFASALGAIVLGTSARDNKVTSEEALKRKPADASRQFPVVLLLLGALLFLPACQTTSGTPPPTAQAVKYFALADTRALMDAAMRTYGEAVVSGKVHPADEAKIDDAHATFAIAYRTAVRAAFYDLGTITPEQVYADALRIVALIQSLK